MKKVLVLLLIIIMMIGFTFNSSASPPRLLDVRSYEELVEIREMVEAGEKAFLNYLAEQEVHSFYRMINFEEIKTFLTVLDSLPIPIINGKELSMRTISYNLDVQEITAISYICTDGYIYSFDIWDFRPMTAAERIEERYNEEPILLYQRKDGNVKIYAYPQSILNEVRFNRFVMDFYGYFVWATYSHGDITDYSNICAEEILGGVTLGSINDLEVMHERRTPLNTSDALTILRAVAGVTALTDAQITRYGISGAPATADALRILRIVAGL
jgi:hypothetical protein